MHTVTIDLDTRSYPIMIGSGLLDQREHYAEHLSGRVMVVTNETVAPLYLDSVLSALGNRPASHVILPDGEAHKSLDTLDLIYTGLLRDGFDRGCTLIALGGGVVGDMAGYAAASYQRGVRFIQVPTTLLAQVDSSVGGKTGVNHRLGKNMIGAFHQPAAVIADMATLNTLDDRELRAGLAEVIKYGFIIDAEFFSWLETHIDALLDRDAQHIAYAVQRSCQIKADVVAADEREQGQRALLNLGHTFGHAIEGSLGYGVWLHGEAVASGTAMALDLSARLGWLDDAQVDRGLALLQRAGLPTTAPENVSASDLKDYMWRDKKVINNELRLILLHDIGHAVVTGEASSDALDATLQIFTGS